MKEIILSSLSKEEFLSKLQNGISLMNPKQRLTIVIDGQTLTYALSDEIIS